MRKKHWLIIAVPIFICVSLAVCTFLSNHLSGTRSFHNSFERASREAFDDEVAEIFTLYIQGGMLALSPTTPTLYNATITLYSNSLLLIDNETDVFIALGISMEYSCNPKYSQQVLLSPEEYAEMLKVVWQIQNNVNHVNYNESINWYKPDYALRIDGEIYYADGNHYPEDPIVELIHYLTTRIDDDMLRLY